MNVYSWMAQSNCPFWQMKHYDLILMFGFGLNTGMKAKMFLKYATPDCVIKSEVQKTSILIIMYNVYAKRVQLLLSWLLMIL